MRFRRLCAAVLTSAVMLSCLSHIYAAEVDSSAAENSINKEEKIESADAILIDECTDFNSAYKHSENLFAYTVPEEDYYAYDTDYSMFRRSTNTAEWLEYEVKEGMYPIFYTYFKYTNDIPHFSFEASEDGENWQGVKPDIKVTKREDWKWIPVTYSLRNINSNQKFVKIIFSDKSEVEWSPMLSSVCARYKADGGAGFSDCVGTPFESAVAKLKGLGLVSGYNKYEFKPYEKVSRAEFSKLNAEILALSSGGNGERVFNDVSADNWAAAYVAALYRHGVINGDGNGNFEPNAEVTYIQAAKMLVCSLGYSAAAADSGGYPDGYRMYAKRLGIYDGLNITDENSGISRGECAQMISNVLEAELIYQSSFGEGVEYIKNGETVLHKYLGTDIVEGIINSAGGMSVISDIQSGRNIITVGDRTYKSAGFNAEELLGRNAKCYVKDDVILYAEPRGGELTRITADKFIKLDGNKIVYEDSGEKEKNISVNANTRIVYNGRYKSRVGVSDEINLSSGYMDLIRNGGSTDVILVWNYTDRIAANSARLSDKITDRLGGSFELDANRSESCHVYAYGEETEFNDVEICKNDIISYAISEDGRVIRVSVRNDSVSGKISSMREDALTIDGTEYKTTDGYAKIGGEPSPGAEVTAFFDMNKRIFAIERGGAEEYVYLQAADGGGVFGDSPMLRIITADGEVAVCSTSGSTRLNGAANKTAEISALAPQLLRIHRRADKTISAIETAENIKGAVGTDTFNLAFKSDSSKYYGGSLCVFASKYQLDARTPVFIVPKDMSDMNKYETGNRGSLITDFDYKVELYDVSDSYVAGAAVVYSDGSRERGVEAYDPVAVIRDSEVINNADGEACLKLSVYTKGEEGYIYFDNDGGDDKTDGWLPDYTKIITENGNNPFKAGEVIQYYSDSKSHCRSFKMMLTSDMIDSGRLYEKNTGDYSPLNSENYFSELYTAHAVVKERFENKLMVSADDAGDVLRTVSLSGTAVYVYDKNRKRLRIGSTADISQGDTVFVKMSYGDTNEIIVEK